MIIIRWRAAEAEYRTLNSLLSLQSPEAARPDTPPNSASTPTPAPQQGSRPYGLFSAIISHIIHGSYGCRDPGGHRL
jgi:hypothetical protein